MSTKSDEWPETIEVRNPQVLRFAMTADTKTPSPEWTTIAEYKLVKVRRVRWIEEREPE